MDVILAIVTQVSVNRSFSIMPTPATSARAQYPIKVSHDIPKIQSILISAFYRS
jgi:hypothetical protein